MNPYLRAIQVLQAGKVPHIVIGGFAVVLHGVSRFTPDLNICCDVTQLDLNTLSSILDAGDFDCTQPEKLTQLAKADAQFSVVSWADRQAPGFRLDIMTKLPVSFQELASQAKKFSLLGVEVALPSIEHLILLKEAAGRNQDRSDVIALRFVQKIGSFGEKALQLPVETNEEFERQILFDFAQLSVEERLEWLSRMLSEFGKFCAL